jgi:LacI family transcriptional regulator
MTTIYDVAKKAGVSVTTVSRVINNHPYVQEGTRQRVKQLLKEMSFIPNSNASSLVRKTTHTIAVIVPDVTNNFFTTLLRGAEDKANENGFAVIFGNTDEDINKEQTYIRTFIERRVDGLIIDPVSSQGKNLKLILKREMPLVIVDREVAELRTDYVGSDNQRGAMDLMRNLIGLGHRRIALISGPQEISVYQQRVTGYRAALEAAGLAVNQQLMLFGNKPNREVGLQLTRAILKLSPRPTAIFAANNFLAIGAVMALREAQLDVPQDMGIVCFDDIDTGAVLNPFFTSVNQPAYMMGQMAVELLIGQMKQKQVSATRIILESDLIRRNSESAGPFLN